MDSGLPALPTSIYSIQHSRFMRQDGWRLDDISLCSSGNIAVSGSNYNDKRSFVCIYSTVDSSDSRDKPTILYEKEFEKYSDYRRYLYISFIKPNSTEIVTCHDDEVTVLDYIRDVVLRSLKMKVGSTCLSVSESQIFIGLYGSNIVYIYDNDLNEIKTIKLKEIKKDWPSDITAVADKLYVCTEWYGRAIAVSQTSGNTQRVYKTTQVTRISPDKACSITVNVHLGVVAILLNRNQIDFHNVLEKKSFLTVNIASDVSRIRLSDQGRIVTANESTGEVEIYDMASLFTFSNLKNALVSMFQRHDCERLIRFFAMAGNESDTIMNNDTPPKAFLLALEEKGVINPSNIDKLVEAFVGLKMDRSFCQVFKVYQKTRAKLNLIQGASFKPVSSLQDHVHVTQEEEEEDNTSVSHQGKAKVKLDIPYPGLSHSQPGGFIIQQQKQQLQQQAQQQPIKTQEYAAFQQQQVALKQHSATLKQLAQQEATVQQHAVLHRQHPYQLQQQQNQGPQQQLLAKQLQLDYNQVHQHHQPVGHRYPFAFDHTNVPYAQAPLLTLPHDFINMTAFNNLRQAAVYNQQEEEAEVYKQQQLAANIAQRFRQPTGGSTFVPHQQHQRTAYSYQQRQQQQQIRQQHMSQHPVYQQHSFIRQQAVTPYNHQFGQQPFNEQIGNRQGTISHTSVCHQLQHHQYQGSERPKAPESTLVGDKRSLFVDCLKKKIKSWSEGKSSIPWEKSNRWKSTDLFVCCELTLTYPKSSGNVKNIEDQCKLGYLDIFSHDKLKSETRIIIEGGPGSGKTMLSVQLAYDWSEGKIKEVEILIYLPVKSVVSNNNMLVQAIKELYIPANVPISEKDIEAVLASESNASCLLLDGLEECNKGRSIRTNETSEVMKVVKKRNHPKCKVVVTTRSGFTKDLQEYPLLKIGRFGKPERNSFIEKLLPDNIRKQEKMKRIIEDDSFLLDFCNVPLLFTLTINSIDKMGLKEEFQIDKVAPFMKNMVEILCLSSTIKHDAWLKKEKLILGELAFNGLCKGKPKVSWQREFVETKVSNFKHWLDFRILVMEEENTVKATGKEFQDIADIEKTKNDRETPHNLAQTSGQQFKEVSHEGEKQSKQAEVVVRFLHKVIQEWFAATYFCSMMRHLTDEDKFHEYLISQLHHISLRDLHYILRFTCYIHPPSCHAIINYLLTSFISKDGGVPSYVMDCICLCFTEHYDIKGPDMENTVTEVCKEVITIDPQDGRLLQLAKASLLQYASNCGVLVKELQLTNAVVSVDETSLTLNSGTKLGPLNTAQVIEVSQWDLNLQQDDFVNILKFLSQGNCIKNIICIFPSQPPTLLDDLIIENAFLKNIEVEWNNGNFIWILDTKKRTFLPVFGTMTKASDIQLKTKEDDFLSYQQFMMSLPGTSASSFDKFPMKRPLSKMFYSDLKGESAAKQLKMDWNRKLSGKEYKKELLDLSKDFFMEKAAGSDAEQKVKKEENPAKGVVPKLVKEETAESSVEQMVVQRERTLEHVTCIVQKERVWLKAQARITQFGGMIEIPNTGVVLRVPPTALPESMVDCLIQMRIIPINMSHDEATSFSSNSSVRVELLPNHLKFRCPVELTLPHCLELKKNVIYRARIFMSHHDEGERPRWEEQKEQCYEIRETECIIWLTSFCWTKYEIDDEIVDGKRLKLYTAAQKMYLEDRCVAVQVGYHLDMPGEQEILQMNPNLILSQRHPFLFLREGRHPLSVLLVRIIPSQWKYLGQNPKEIPFHSVAASVEHSCLFLVEKENQDRELPMCEFKASQIQRIGGGTTERNVDLMIRPEVHPFATPWDVKW